MTGRRDPLVILRWNAGVPKPYLRNRSAGSWSSPPYPRGRNMVVLDPGYPSPKEAILQSPLTCIGTSAGKPGNTSLVKFSSSSPPAISFPPWLMPSCPAGSWVDASSDLTNVYGASPPETLVPSALMYSILSFCSDPPSLPVRPQDSESFRRSGTP